MAPPPSMSADQAIQFMTAFFTAQARNPMPVPPMTGVVHASPIVSQPLPSPSWELETFLVDFLRLKGIDFTDHQAALEELGITPDVILDMSIIQTIALMGLLEGQVVKLQRFVEEWSKSLAQAHHLTNVSVY